MNCPRAKPHRNGTATPVSEMLNAARSSELADRDFLVSVADAYRRMAGVTA